MVVLVGINKFEYRRTYISFSILTTQPNLVDWVVTPGVMMIHVR